MDFTHQFPITIIFDRCFDPSSVAFLICALLVLLIQIIYFTLLLVAFARRREQESVEPQPVSVIVCAHDEEENLRVLIPLLLAQDHPAFEVIVVEDRCNDGTYDYLLQATREDSRLRMVRVTQKPDHINGKKFALTLAIKAAKYDWVLLTDADCRPASVSWIASMSRRFTPSAQLVLGASPYERQPGVLNDFIRYESLLTTVQFMGMAAVGHPYMGVGRNLAYRRELFLSAKGFGNHLDVTGGDDDLFVNEHATATNTQITWGAESLMVSLPKTTVKDFLHQKLRHLAVGKHYSWRDKIWLSLVSISWLATWFIVTPGLFFSLAYAVILPLVLLRLALLMTVLAVAVKKMGWSFEWWKTPFLDFIYGIYYLVTGAKALVVKRVKWKN